MADILPFPKGAGRRKPDLSDLRPGAPVLRGRICAEIVIFPGVRIERRNFTLADRLPARKSACSDNGDGKPRHGRG